MELLGINKWWILKNFSPNGLECFIIIVHGWFKKKKNIKKGKQKMRGVQKIGKTIEPSSQRCLHDIT